MFVFVFELLCFCCCLYLSFLKIIKIDDAGDHWASRIGDTVTHTHTHTHTHACMLAVADKLHKAVRCAQLTIDWSVVILHYARKLVVNDHK